MTEVTLVGGRLTVKKEPAAKNGKPRKYPFPQEQFNHLLKIAKTAGIDTGDTKASQTKAVNLIVKAALDAFIAEQQQQKEPKK